LSTAIRTVPPFISGATRYLLAGALMYLWLRVRDARSTRDLAANANPSGTFAGVNLPMAALCGVLLSGVGNGYIIWAQQGIPSGIAALMVASVPILVLILDWAFFSKRAPTAQALAGTAIAVAGVVTLVMHTHSLSGHAGAIYLAALLVAVLAWSLGTLLQKQHARKDNVLSFTCAQMLAGGAFQLLLARVAAVRRHGGLGGLDCGHCLSGGLRQHRRTELLFVVVDARARSQSHHVCTGQSGGGADSGSAGAQ